MQMCMQISHLAGVLLRSLDGSRNYPAPFTLFPSPVPRQCFEKMMHVQTVYNKLMHKVAHDHDFLSQCLSRCARVMAFSHEHGFRRELIYKYCHLPLCTEMV